MVRLSYTDEQLDTLAYQIKTVLVDEFIGHEFNADDLNDILEGYLRGRGYIRVNA